MSELFTSGSVGGAAGNCCLYPATRIGKLVFIVIGWACEGYKAATALRWTCQSCYWRALAGASKTTGKVCSIILDT